MALRMADVFDVAALQREVERRTNSAGLRVYFEHDCPQPYIQGDTMHLPMMHVPFDMDDFRMVRMLYIHELGHWFNKDAMKLRRKWPIDIQSNLGGLWNLLEDELDEKLSAEAYRGDAKALGEGHVIYLGRQLVWIKKNIVDTGAKLEDSDIKRMACYILAKETRDWDDFAPPLCIQMRRTLPPEVAALTDTLISEGWATKIRALRTAEDVIELAKLLHKRLFPEEPDAQEQMQQAADKAKEDKEKGDKEEGGEGEDEKDGESGEGEDGEGKPEKGECAVIGRIPWEKLLHSNHDDGMVGSAKASFIDWTGKPPVYRAFKPATKEQFEEIHVYTNKRYGK